jgi:hypothetical protein
MYLEYEHSGYDSIVLCSTVLYFIAQYLAASCTSIQCHSILLQCAVYYILCSDCDCDRDDVSSRVD